MLGPFATLRLPLLFLCSLSSYSFPFSMPPRSSTGCSSTCPLSFGLLLIPAPSTTVLLRFNIYTLLFSVIPCLVTILILTSWAFSSIGQRCWLLVFPLQKLCSSGFCAVETLPSNACYRRAQADFGARHPGVEEAWARAKGRGPRTIKPKPVIASQVPPHPWA